MRVQPTSTEKLLAHVDGGIGWVTFNNPEKHNAMTGEMFAALSELTEAWEDDDEVRVVVARGAGERAFVSGADIGDFGSGIKNVASTRPRRRLLETSKPVIAMIHGYCIGGGLMVALGADIRVAADDAQFGVPAAKLGIAYPYDAVQHLVTLVGPEWTSRILLTAERIGAVDALRIGLISQVVPKVDLEAVVVALAGNIARLAPLSLHASKTSVRAAVRGSQSDDLDAVSAAAGACWTSEDFAEGRRAFAEKRPAAFRGR